MLIGEDFLHAHRIYVDVSDHLALFSDEGGLLFAAPPAVVPGRRAAAAGSAPAPPPG
jgi:hypothetical protein